MGLDGRHPGFSVSGGISRKGEGKASQDYNGSGIFLLRRHGFNYRGLL